MKRGRERKDMKTSQHVAPSPIFPLNAFAVDLGLLTESFKRRWILLALIASRRTFPPWEPTLNPFTHQQGLEYRRGWGSTAFDQI